MKQLNKPNLKVASNKFGRKITSKIKKKPNGLHTSRKNPWVYKKNRKDKKETEFNEILITAPNKIEFYNRNFFDSTNRFIKDFQAAIKKAHSAANTIVRLCLRDTEYISAAAALYLLAETDKTIKIYSNAKFQVAYPKSMPLNLTKKPRVDVHGILIRLGFYKLLGKNPTQLKQQENVKCWDYVTGEVANGQLAGNLIDKFVANKVDTGALYRGAVEALSNAVEHAYDSEIKSSANIDDKRWWMLIAKLNNRLVVLICDLGHGIPNTLEITQSPELLSRIWTKLGGKNQTDGQYIEASTLVKKTRTDQKNRGKGGKDLTSLVDNYDNSILSIFSMKGVYRYVNKQKVKGVAYDHKTAINGTIVEWSIPLTGNFKTK
jgi:hypothetical protein